MTKYLLSLSLLFIGQAIYSQGCSEVFISEYLEGWSNNKAIELYNPTAAAIDLADYRLERYSNGSTSAADNQKLDLGGTIDAYSTWVIVIDKRDPDGTGQEAPVWEELQAAADTFMCPIYDVNNAMYFNGNDALVLRRISTTDVIDVFGKIGEDPGNPSDGGGWNDVAPDFSWNLNGAVAWTSNHTLVRKSEVDQGDVNPIDGFDVSAQYDSLLANTFTGLGSHECVCDVNSVEEIQLSLGIYPNPSNDGYFKARFEEEMASIRVYSLGGRLVYEDSQVAAGLYEFDLSSNPAGIYLIDAIANDGGSIRERIVIR